MTNKGLVGLFAQPERHLTDVQLDEIARHIMTFPEIWTFVKNNHETSWYSESDVRALWGVVREYVIERQLHMFGGDQIELSSLLRRRAVEILL